MRGGGGGGEFLELAVAVAGIINLQGC